MGLEFVRFEKAASRFNKNGRSGGSVCKCCGAGIINIVVLSDNNDYGIDCALKLQGLTETTIKEIKDSVKDKKYKYFICYYVPTYDQYHGHTWITDISEEKAVAKFAKKTRRDLDKIKVLKIVEKTE